MKILSNVPLSEHTTFKLGGPAAFFVSASSIQEIKEAIQFAEDKKLPHMILGGGSNILFPDNGWHGVVIQVNIAGISYKERGKEVLVVASAGELWDDFVADTVEKGLWGLENLSGIPGNVGATPVQNVGAYGVEVADRIVWVDVYDRQTKKVERILNSDLNFSYRSSIFKISKGRNFIVLRVCFLLHRDGRAELSYKDVSNHFLYSEGKSINPSILEMRNAILSIRKTKFPDIHSSLGTAGSFFKNPIVTVQQIDKIKRDFPKIPFFPFGEGKVKVSLAWILDNALHIKKERVNSVGVFENQSLVLVNYGGASTEDILIFAENIQKKVWNKFKIRIVPEVTIVNNKNKLQKVF